MKKLTPVILSLAFVLAACEPVDMTGLTEESSRQPKGNPSALVVVTEYGDLQCPACKASHEIITKPLLQKYGSRIRFDFKHFPLQTIHPYALKAAMASECAADQGKFWEFLDLNYAKQSDMNNSVFEKWAGELGLDADLFGRCLASNIKKKTVMDDYADGERMKVNSTPSYFVGTVQVSNNLDAISAAIDEAFNNGSSVPL